MKIIKMWIKELFCRHAYTLENILRIRHGGKITSESYTFTCTKCGHVKSIDTEGKSDTDILILTD